MIKNNHGEVTIQGNADIVLAEFAGIVHHMVETFDNDGLLVLEVCRIGLATNYDDTTLMMNQIYKLLEERGYRRI